MTNIIILGTIGIDTIVTPFGKREDILGGSAVYASYAASFFDKTGIISVRGEDLDPKKLSFLEERGVSLDGLSVHGKNFRWSGAYEFDMNEAKTLKTELNSLATFNPKMPDSFRNSKYFFLANVDPVLQLKVIEEMNNPELIVIDTMNYWIESNKEKLIEAIKKTNILIVNDGEARQLFETSNLVQAAKKALSLGIKSIIIKKGEHGSLMFSNNDHFNCPGYPLEEVKDPTGCGDSFAGAFIGHYAQSKNIRKAMVYGSAVASFTAQDFGLDKLRSITYDDIEKRLEEISDHRLF